MCSSEYFEDFWSLLDPTGNIRCWEENPDDAWQRERGAGPRFDQEMKDQFLIMLVRLHLNLTECVT